MGDRHKATIGRRQLLRTGIIGIVATTASALEIGTVAADTETNARHPAGAKLVPTMMVSPARELH